MTQTLITGQGLLIGENDVATLIREDRVRHLRANDKWRVVRVCFLEISRLAVCVRINFSY